MRNCLGSCRIPGFITQDWPGRSNLDLREMKWQQSASRICSSNIAFSISNSSTVDSCFCRKLEAHKIYASVIRPGGQHLGPVWAISQSLFALQIKIIVSGLDEWISKISFWHKIVSKSGEQGLTPAPLVGIGVCG